MNGKPYGKPYLDLSACAASPISGNATQRAGLYYERRVADWFARRFLCAEQPRLYFPGKWSRPRRPDLLVFDPAASRCVVVEVKHQYTPAAHEQLYGYAEAIGWGYPWWNISTLVVCGQVLEYPKALLVPVTSAIFTLPSPSVMLLSKRELRLGKCDGLDSGGELAPAALRELGGTRHASCEYGSVFGLSTEAGKGISRSYS